MNKNELLSAEDFIALVKRLQSPTRIAEYLKTDPRVVRARITRLEKKHGRFYVNSDPRSTTFKELAGEDKNPEVELTLLRDQLRTIKLELIGARRESVTDEYVRRELLKLKTRSDTLVLPGWLVSPTKPTKTLGVPTLFASDWHWAETVYPSN